MSEPVGIIGLGLLGGAIARRLHSAGFAVHGFDPEPPAPEVAAAVELHPDAPALVTVCPTVILSLPTSSVVREVVSEVGGRWNSGQRVVDTTTGDPADAAATAAELAGLGVSYVEACVAGSSTQVLDGEATLFLAGPEAVLTELDPVIRAISDTPLTIGNQPGAAARFKLVHNLVLGLHRAVLAEALQFGEALGFDPGRSLDLLVQTPAASEVMRQKGQRIATRNYADPQARLAQHLKDVRLILAEADRAGAHVPLSSLHRELLEKAESLGLADADNTAIREAFGR